MPEFKRSRKGVALKLDETESAILRQLIAELRALLMGRHGQEDPVIRRLFPAAYEDPDDEIAYREMTGTDLEAEKLRALDVVSTTLGAGATEVKLEGEDFHTWLACITDLRLAIGTKLDVDEERMSSEIDPKDQDAQAMTVLHWLGWLQEGLLGSAR